MLEVKIISDNFELSITVNHARHNQGDKVLYHAHVKHYSIKCTASTFDINNNDSWIMMQIERDEMVSLGEMLIKDNELLRYIKPSILVALTDNFPHFSGVLVLTKFDIVPF